MIVTLIYIADDLATDCEHSRYFSAKTTGSALRNKAQKIRGLFLIYLTITGQQLPISSQRKSRKVPVLLF